MIIIVRLPDEHGNILVLDREETAEEAAARVMAEWLKTAQVEVNTLKVQVSAIESKVTVAPK